RESGSSGLEMEARGITSLSKWDKIVGAGTLRNCVWHVNESLCRLSNGHIGDHLIRQRVNDSGLEAVFQCDVNTRTITGRPNAVGEVPYRNGRNRRWGWAPAKHFHFAQSSNRDVGKFAVAVVGKVDMVCDRSCIQQRLLLERRLRIE